MKDSKINLTIKLDEENVPEQILWDASDQGLKDQQSKAITLSLWDHVQKNTMRIDLWTKEMPVDEMKRFYVDCVGGLAQSLLTATGDEFMAAEMNQLCDRLVEHMKKEDS